MLAHRVVSFGALATLLASYSGIYHDAFTAVAVPACMVNMISLPSLLFFFFLFLQHTSFNKYYI